ncbi:MAG: hypothetical protein LBS96_00285 [Oscillospiraceae bacterium]|jgi:hypothetical protein|nr:hypothetical protein [Oscillospiraceae bacterium]
MPTLTVHCDACGAAVPVEAANPVVTCEYCGTSAKNPLYIEPKPKPEPPHVWQPVPSPSPGEAEPPDTFSGVVRTIFTLVFLVVFIIFIVGFISTAREVHLFGGGW